LNRKLAVILGAIVTLAVPFVIMLTTDHQHLVNEQSFCPFKMLTGFPCPGCGITKSIIFFYQGDLSASIHYHLFGAFTVIVCFAVIITLAIELITHKEYFKQIIFNKKIAIFLGATLGAYHFIRLIFFIAENSIDSILKQSIWQ